DIDAIMAEARRISVYLDGQARARQLLAGGVAPFKAWLERFLLDFIKKIRDRGYEIRFFPERDPDGDRRKLLHGIEEILSRQGASGLTSGHMDALIGVYFDIRRAGG